MKVKHEFRGIHCTRSGVWVTFARSDQAVGHLYRVRVPWEHVAAVQEGLEQGMERVFLRRIADEAQQEWLPLEKWE